MVVASKCVKPFPRCGQGGGGILVGDHLVGYCEFGGRDFDTRGLDFGVAGLGAAVDLGSGFLGLAVLLVAGT